MLKKVAVGLLVLGILGYVAGVATRDGHVYVLCFVILVATILFMLLVLAMNLIWKLLPVDFKKTYEGKKSRFNAVIFFSVLLFYIVAGIIDEFCLHDADEIIRQRMFVANGFTSLLANTTTFVFAVFLGWSLIRRSKGKTIVAGSIVFILFIALLSFVSSTALKSGEIGGSSSIAKLTTLPYVGWVPAGKDIEKRGVVRYDRELAFDGMNLYASNVSPEAYLIDMDGNIVNKWAKITKGGDYWHHIEMCENGDFWALGLGFFIRLDWDSNIKFKKKLAVHHDICIDENKKIHVLTLKFERVFRHGIPVPIFNDYIVVLSPDGEIKRKISVYDMAKERIPLHRIVRIHRMLLRIFKPKNILRILILRISECKRDMTKNYSVTKNYTADILHTNSIEVMDRDIEGFCRKGDWLISMRHLDLVAVVDAKKEEFAWSWGQGELSWQHHATLLKNGNVLIFDNGCIRGSSRVVELNPLTKKIVWEYKSETPEKFYSWGRGGNQRLPNGNTLITESNKGRVFEITKEGKVVWEFYNPSVKTQTKEREAIYRMMRITYPEIKKLIKK